MHTAIIIYINRLVCVYPCVCVCVSVCVQMLIAPRQYVARFQILPTPHNPRTGICRYLARNSATLPSGGNALRHASVGVRCEMV